MQQSKDGRWYHGRSSHDGYVLVPAKLLEERYQTWQNEHPHATEQIEHQMKELFWSANLWDSYAQRDTTILILEVYALVEKQMNNDWHLLFRLWGKTIANETLTEELLTAWLRDKKAEHILQSSPHPLSGVYTLPGKKP